MIVVLWYHSYVNNIWNNSYLSANYLPPTFFECNMEMFQILAQKIQLQNQKDFVIFYCEVEKY